MGKQSMNQSEANSQTSDGEDQGSHTEDSYWQDDPACQDCSQDFESNFAEEIQMDCSQCQQVEDLESNLRTANKGLTELMVEMEDRITRRTEQLQSVNEELDAFAYSVSHDLRQPLRVIGGFSEALLEDYKANLDDVGSDYLMRIQRGAERMSCLIDDLMHLAKATGGSIEKTEINLSEMAATIAAQIEETDTSRNVKFIIPAGLNANGDQRLIQVALENLLGNAWKFTAKSPNPTIEIGMLKGEGENTYFVRDNGAGFNMAYADKLFGAFERAHRESEFPGNGIGLATVCRAINRHGGKVWAEGQEGAGATFFFTL